MEFISTGLASTFNQFFPVTRVPSGITLLLYTESGSIRGEGWVFWRTLFSNWSAWFSFLNPLPNEVTQGLFIWARSTGLAQFSRSPLAILSFVKILMFSYMRSRAGPVTEISVFATEISVTGMKIFPNEHSSTATETKLFRQNSTLGVYESALLVKLQ